MTTTSMTSFSRRRNWSEAFTALRQLLNNAGDTAQVFKIMRMLNAGSVRKGYTRLLGTPQGGRIAYRRTELATRFSDPAFVGQFAESTVGGAYAAFLDRTGYSAKGLADVSRADDPTRDAEHPYAWYGRRNRDTHDIWHILTGYRADDPLGEACLVAFSFAQTKGLGWALIAVGSALKSLRTPLGFKAVGAIWEGFRHGRRAAWLPGEDYEVLLGESLDGARQRLRIAPANAYLALDRAQV